MSALCFSETWLTETIMDSCVQLPGFTTVRADRDAKTGGKNKGGGVGFVCEICCQDSELLTVGLRPYYVPREFSHIVAVVVHVPPRADPAVACDVTLKSVARLQTLHPH